MVKNWIALFSQSGSEIFDISEKIGIKPNLVITNSRPDHLRTIDDRVNSHLMHETANYPLDKTLQNIFKQYSEDCELIITLHGWLRIMPPTVCENFEIYNGHPGLITKYPELKGKDPQARMMEGDYDTMGCVLHEVTPGVDEGVVLLSKEVSRKGLEDQDIFRILSNISQELWVDFLKNKL